MRVYFLVRDREIGGSNPLAPTTLGFNQVFTGQKCLKPIPNHLCKLLVLVQNHKTLLVVVNKATLKQGCLKLLLFTQLRLLPCPRKVNELLPRVLNQLFHCSGVRCQASKCLFNFSDGLAMCSRICRASAGISSPRS